MQDYSTVRDPGDDYMALVLRLVSDTCPCPDLGIERPASLDALHTNGPRGCCFCRFSQIFVSD